MSVRFEKQMQLLNNMLIEMGALIEATIANSIEALKNQDMALAQAVIDADEDVDRKEKEIEALCIELLLRYQPVASDLRLISSALKMITDMERIGDQAADISEITIMLAGIPYAKKLEHIPMMAEATVKMVTESIDAFVKRDLRLARSVIEYDDVVDDYFDLIKMELVELMRDNGSKSEQAIDLLMIAKYFERIGDHAVNIAEWVEFSITGSHAKTPFGEKEEK